MLDIENLQVMSNRLRKAVLRMTTEAGSGHPTSCMSCAEIVTTLFFNEMNWDPNDPDNRNYDFFLMSKGHAAPILYAALKEAGALKNEDLMTLRKFGSALEGHPSVKCPFVKVATGSLGQGLSAACGMALARKNDGIESFVYALLGDGEAQEGSVWEAANFASHNKLNNLIAVVDVNRLGQSGPTMFEYDCDGYAKRFQAFGWNTKIVDGHSVKELTDAFSEARNNAPFVVIAKTVKGKGVPFLEDEKGSHGKAVSKDRLEEAIACISNHPVPVEVTPKKKYQRETLDKKPDVNIKLPYKKGDNVATREAYGYALKELGNNIKNLYVLDADVKNSTFSEKFLEDYPGRFVQNFIAEQNMAGVALGLAVEGKIPTLSSFACFLTRAFDFFRMGAYSRPKHYIVCGSHAGISIGEDGASQMGLEDIAMMKGIYESAVVYPADAVASAKLTCELVKNTGISYIRTTRPKTRVIYDANEQFPIGGSKTVKLSPDDKATVIACGVTLYEALDAYEALKEEGINIRVVDLYSIKPIDELSIQNVIDQTGTIVTCEDHSIYGGMGDEVSKIVSSYGKPCKFKMLAVKKIPVSGPPKDLLKDQQIDSASIVDAVKQLI